LVGGVIVVVGALLGAVSMHNVFLFVVYLIAICTLFALLGIITGLWSNNFEQLNILSTFVIMPFSFLGGMFYTLDMLPRAAQVVTLFNPFFYMIDGMRYSMTGIHSASLAVGACVITTIIVVLFGLVWYLFRSGWRIRE
jgi:ABC-2 type transport system permease protein